MWANVLFLFITVLIIISGYLWILSNKNNKLLKLAVISNIILFSFILLFYFFFINLFITHQYGINVVYQNSNNQMPFLLLISSSWAGQAGSLFLSLVMHSITLLIVLKFKKHQAFVSPILLLNQAIILFLLFKAQPFQKTPVNFLDGLGLNPVLSHIYMSIHPPFAFLGYAMLSLLFAFAIAHLIHPIDIDWLVHVKKWVYCAFFSLTCTIILGSLWAYAVLGWGGLWAFDPIENASLVSWILLLLLIHHINWYQKRKVTPQFPVFLIIVLFASMTHMIMLLRSGLMEKLTQHAYLGDKLFSSLQMVDIFYFLIPFLIFLFRYKRIETGSNKEYYTSTFYVKVLLSIIFLFIAALLFIQINQPLLQRWLPITFPTNFSRFLPLFNLSILSLLVLIQIPVWIRLFQRNRHKIQQASYAMTSLLLAVLLTFLLIIVTDVSIAFYSVTILFIFFAALWIVQSIQVEKKDDVKTLVDNISHIAISILIISFTLSSVSTSSKSLFLLPSDSVTLEKDSFNALESSGKKAAYIGNIETYSLEIKTGNHAFETHPSIWTYERKSVSNQLRIPYIQQVGLFDMLVIPKRNNQIEFQPDEIVYYKNFDLVITNKIFSRSSDQSVLKLESADLIVKRYNKAGYQIEPYETEVLHLNAVTTHSNQKYEISPSFSEFLGAEIRWNLSESNAIILHSADWFGGIQYEIVKKPFVIGIRFGYYLLLAAVFLRLVFFWFKRGGRQYLFPSYQHELKKRRHK